MGMITLVAMRRMLAHSSRSLRLRRCLTMMLELSTGLRKNGSARCCGEAANLFQTKAKEDSGRLGIRYVTVSEVKSAI